MSDILTTIAAVEWIVVGCLFLWRLRHWDGVERVVTEALAHGNKVVINADW